MALYGSKPDQTGFQGGARQPIDKVYGLGWPIGVDAKAPYFNKSSNEALIRSQVKQILLTQKGERVMLPNFGVSLNNFLFNPLTSDTANELAIQVKTAIDVYAPNIEVIRVQSRSEENLKGYGLPGIVVSVAVKSRDNNNLVDINITI